MQSLYHAFRSSKGRKSIVDLIRSSNKQFLKKQRYIT